MQKKYKNPPLVELICEFRLPPECAWDLTMPGLIYERVKAEFPDKKSRLIQHLEIMSGREGTGQKLRAEERILFQAREGKIFLEIGSRLLGVHSQVTPYPGWQHFKPKIEVGFKALIAVSNTDKLRRISLRYVNRIEVPDESGALGEYFNFRPLLADNEGMAITSFIGGTRFSTGDDSCKVELQSAGSDNPDNRAFMLEIDYSLAPDKAIEQQKALQWVESAHEKVDELFFERCVMDPLRRLFQEVKSK